MGLSEMFTSDADLSGLLEERVPLYVSDTVHKAIIEVNEEGSEAAAATGTSYFFLTSFSRDRIFFSNVLKCCMTFSEKRFFWKKFDIHFKEFLINIHRYFSSVQVW